ncbi:PA0069 family radical SAM protein [Mangrovicoccus algicola]|uniref:PA0069 family radical SAM protein n=1 Tax=Mangrovicoccus algicola TaxID=2771008 RepID=A0A8J6Z7C5_9RHOB|nr:PA0069 family radical SAM protein [Mangrovicoccus algicola]MBE3637835.1 PA0069 family radical SAM protein [Mangrovicoccus algicola]
MRRHPIAPERRRARGAASNDTPRFDALAHVPFNDGWDIAEDLPFLRTHVAHEQARRILTRNTSPDIGFDRSINPYRGCEHGCIYCYARPSHAYLGLSPGLDFETRLTVKPNAPDLLARELSAPGYSPQPIAIGTNTDAYQPIEKQHEVMRRILEVLLDFRHPVTITTKGTLIERDLDLVSRLAERGLVQVGISVTTLDPALSRKMEPRVPVPARRLGTIARLSRAGVPVRIMMSPVIPALTDHEIERVLEAGKAAGARGASWIMLRLPLEVADLFRDWLQEHYPDRAARVMARLRETQGGRDYRPDWGRRMRGEGVHANLVARRFELAARRLGLDGPLPPLDLAQFRVPPRPGDQLSLF